MSLSIWFWILVLLYLLFGGWSSWKAAPENRVGTMGGGLLLFLIIVILGLAAFGSPVKGG